MQLSRTRTDMNALRIQRYYFLLLIFTLLFAQQAGAAHALHHAFEDLPQQQKSKQAPHSNSCEKCADYAQLGNALTVAAYDLVLPHVSYEVVSRYAGTCQFSHVLAAVARGPPSLHQYFA